MTDKKLILRVITKLFAIFAVLAVVYVLFQGLLSNEATISDEQVVLLDVSALKPGAVQYFDFNRRKALVLHRARGQLLVAYASDPVFGCPIEWQGEKFVSVCNASQFYADGKVYKGQVTDEDMKLLNFNINAKGIVKVWP
ncbi:MAG: hypothetical protein OQL09_04930 [Gammaproteobacteria bacterium]|nr:hypothetical protein [Gammaproteobacteria bacterium]